MTLEEKIAHLQATSMEQARLEGNVIIDTHQAALEKVFEDHKAEATRQSETRVKAEAANAKLSLNQALAKSQLEIKRRQSKIQQELKDKIFEEADALIDEFMKTEAYDDFLNNFSLEWNVLSGLKLKGNISLNRKTVTSDKFLPGEHTSFQNSSLNGSYTKTIEEYFTYDANVTLSYTRSFGKHQLNGVGVWNVKETRSDMFETVAYNFPNSNMDHIGMGIEYGKGDQPDGNYEVSRLMGFVANFNYGYDNRYLVDASIRSDGSSLFGSDKRWGTFGSIGLAWNLHNESWMKNLGWFDQLKLRGSWGTTGGQNFYPYQAMMMFSYKDELLSSREDSEDENNSQTYDGYIGALLKAFGNTNLKWQKTEKRSIGLYIAK